MAKSACFLSEIKIDKNNYQKIKEKIENVVISLIEMSDVKTFYVSDYNDFQKLCFDVIFSLKNEYSDLIVCMVFTNQNSNELEIYKQMIEKSDFCMFYNSKNHSDLVLESLEYAKQTRTVIDLINPLD